MRFGLIACTFILLVPASVAAQVNINAATKQQMIDQVEGIGATTADRIIEYRSTHGAIPDIATLCQLRAVAVTTQTCRTIQSGVYFGPLGSSAAAEEGQKATSSGTSAVEIYEEQTRFPVRGLVARIPEFAYVGQSVRFEAMPDDGVRDRLVRYVWNYGDGTTEVGNGLTHEFRFPGTYVVVVEGSYLKEAFMARGQIKILPVEVSLVESADAVTITNNGAQEIDLGGMRLVGREEFTFSAHSIILPQASITVPLSGHTPVRLIDRSGRPVATNAPVAAEPPPPAARAAPQKVQPAQPAAAATNPDPTQPAVHPVPVADQTASIAAADDDEVPQAFWPYLGLVGLIGLGLFVVFFGRR